MTKPINTCVVWDCTTSIPLGRRFCAACWARVPAAHKQLVKAAAEADDGSPARREAHREAIVAAGRAIHRPVPPEIADVGLALVPGAPLGGLRLAECRAFGLHHLDPLFAEREMARGERWHWALNHAYTLLVTCWAVEHNPRREPLLGALLSTGSLHVEMTSRWPVMNTPEWVAVLNALITHGIVKEELVTVVQLKGGA
ncbi:hypothetical protein L6R49_10500 [Myxococcota bacterium]|nr:hypothetical protein [Myxococcota bacterium]